jgi:hypothetical protein
MWYIVCIAVYGSMAANLPRNAKALHFTGAVRALGVPQTEPPPPSRHRAPPQSRRHLPPSRGPESTVRPSARMRAAQHRAREEDILTPYMGVSPASVLPAPRSRPTLHPPPPADLLDIEEIELEEIEAKEDDTGDRDRTVAFARDTLPPVSSRIPPATAVMDKPDARPIPHFRSKADVAIITTPAPSPAIVLAPSAAARSAAAPRTGSGTKATRRGAPLLLWLAASIVAAAFSYHYAPSALRAAERAVGSLEVR